MSFIFERNAELYVSNVLSEWNSGNTDKIPLKAGFSFNSEQVLSTYSRNTIKATDSRSVSKYSAKESLIDFNFSTYLNPVQLANIESTDRYLWTALGTYTPGATYSQVSFTSSNTALAKEITIWVKFLNKTVYRLNQCVITSAEIVGSMNELTHVVWSGKARSIEDIGNISVASTSLTIENYIINKLSTINLSIDAATYDIPITNYSINIRNDVLYVYRGKIGKIQEVTGQYTSDRGIEGDFNAYLKIGTDKSGELLNDLRSVAGDLENNTANFTIYTGNLNNTHARFIMPNTILDIPSQQFTDLVTLRVPYSALESSKGAADELTVRYYL